MSGDSKDSKNGGDDLLSELLDLEEPGDRTEVISKTADPDQADSFSKKTEGFVLPEDSEREDSKTEKLAPSDEQEASEDFLDVFGDSDHTEVLSTEKPVSSPPSQEDSLDSFLFEEDDQTEFSSDIESKAAELDAEMSGLEDFNFTGANPETSEMDSVNEDNPFEGDHVDKTLTLDSADIIEPSHPEADPSSTVLESPFEAIEEATAFEAPPEEIFSQDSGETLPSDSAPSESLSSSASDVELDPIDAALREFSDDNRKSQMEGGQKESSSSVLEEPSFEEPSVEASSEEDPLDAALHQAEDSFSKPSSPHASAQVAQEDFADVFQSGPIEVPQDPARSSRIFERLRGRSVAYAGVAVICFLLVGASLYFLRSEEGVLGVRMEGFSFVPTYRPPSAEDLRDFARIINDSVEARRLDDPARLTASIAALNSVLERDSRNFEASSELLEVIGRSLSWRGVQSGLIPQFDAAVQQNEQIRRSLRDESFDMEQVERALAWRSLSLNEFSRSREQLLGLQSRTSRALQSDSYELLFELSFRAGDIERAKEFAKSVEKPSSRRFRHFEALMNKDQRILRGLAAEAYLPSEIEVQFGQDFASVEKGRELLSRSVRILDEVQDYPWLVQRVQGARGELFARIGQNEEARREWESIVKNFPDSSVTWGLLAKSYQEAMMWDESISAYESALRTGGMNLDLAHRYARLLREQNKYIEALTLLGNALQAFPDSVNLHYELGVTQKTIFQDAPAKASLEKALELDSNFEPALVALADLAIRREEFDEADALYARVPASSSSYSKALLGRARLAIRRFQMSEAKALVRRSIQSDPGNVEAYLWITRLLIREGAYQEAIEINERARSQMPDKPLLAAALASVHVERGNSSRALELLEPYLDSYSHLSPLKLVYADALMSSGQFSEAREVLNKLVSVEVNNSELSYQRAKLFYLDDSERSPLFGGRDSAQAFIRQALGMDQNNEKYLLLAARISRKMDARDDARNFISQVINLYPDSWRAYEQLGHLEFEAGNHEAAMRAFSTAERGSPHKARLFQAMARVHRANGESRQALVFYERVMSLRPRDAQVRLEVGRILNEEGSYALALRHLRTATELNPNLSEAYYYLGFIQKELGDYPAALRSFRNYIQREPQGLEAATVKDEIYFLEQFPSAN